MSKHYSPSEIEAKWQAYWQDHQLFEAQDGDLKPKYYALIEFPYPSAEGLHVGHPRSFTAMDIIARKKRMQGFNVLYPIGWDAFGLPAENFAIKTGTHPRVKTEENIQTFKRQLKSLGISFDWSREVNTTDPKYYKWTQWIFLQLFKHGLAYKVEMPINFCLDCKVGLANEEVVNGQCERCGGEVVKKNKSQWMLRITRYADRLIKDLDAVDYLEQIKTQQINWIGKSTGAEIDFKIKDTDHKLKVYTTRPDTLFGATYMVVAPEHELVLKLKDKIQNFAEVEKYITEAAKKSDLERTELNKEKTGVELKGVKAVNPVNGVEIPVWISDYVLAGYGTGAIMAVPAHDERDYEFAKKFKLDIIEVISGGNIAKQAYTDIDNGKMVNSDFLDGLIPKEAIVKMTDWLEDNNHGVKAVNYKLRDWVFSRQRYWGEPIPVVYCESCAKKKQKVLLIHGFADTGEGNWLPWLKIELEKQGFEVFNPTLSNSKAPDLKTWLSELKEYVDQLGEDDMIIAHSLGTKAAVHLIEKNKKRIGHLFLIGSLLGGQRRHADMSVHQKQWPGTDFEALLKFNEAPVDLKTVDKLVGSVNLVLSDDDPFIQVAPESDLPKGWMMEIVTGQGHFQVKESPFILNLILDVKNTGWIPLEDKDLPLELPEVKEYEASEDGQSPLAKQTDWIKTKCPKCGGDATRETDTMPQWAGSSWYFLRYIDPKNDRELAAEDKLNYWSPVDWYNGGMEHTTLHLLYSRFWHKFLYDIKHVPTSEPYLKRTAQGMVLGEGGEKMSKSRGNVVNPDEVVKEYGADTLRVYEMFMGPFDQAIPWDTKGVVGVRRFLEKVWNLSENIELTDKADDETEVLLNKTIKKVTEDIDEMRFNTAISALMILVNKLTEKKQASKKVWESLLIILSPFAPHLAEELWSQMGKADSVCLTDWPAYDSARIIDAQSEFAVQINGKVRAKLSLASDITQAAAVEAAQALPNVKKYLANKSVKKVIFVPGRIIGFVV